MGPKEKKRFEDMALKDKERWERDMQNYVPAPGEKIKRKRTKDPNAPKRALWVSLLCELVDEIIVEGFGHFP